MTDEFKNELEQEDYEFYLENVNPYSSQKPKFNAFQIIDEGIIPELDNDADRYRCAVEVGFFIRKNGIFLSNRKEYTENVLRLWDKLPKPHIVQCIRQLTLQQMEDLSRIEDDAIVKYNNMLLELME